MSSSVAALRHPLLVLAVSASLTLLLIPAITRVWQDRPRELDLKNRLVAQIAESATTTVNRGRELAREPGDRRGRHFPAKGSWLVASAVVAADLATYFPAKTRAAWGDFTNRMVDYLLLSSARSARARQRATDRLEAYLTPLGGTNRKTRAYFLVHDIQWKHIAGGAGAVRRQLRRARGAAPDPGR